MTVLFLISSSPRMMVRGMPRFSPHWNCLLKFQFALHTCSACCRLLQVVTCYATCVAHSSSHNASAGEPSRFEDTDLRTQIYRAKLCQVQWGQVEMQVQINGCLQAIGVCTHLDAFTPQISAQFHAFLHHACVQSNQMHKSTRQMSRMIDGTCNMSS